MIIAFLVFFLVLLCTSDADLGVRFCDPVTDDVKISQVQPSTQGERFKEMKYEPPFLSFVVSPHEDLCGKRMKSYIVDVTR